MPPALERANKEWGISTAMGIFRDGSAMRPGDERLGESKSGKGRSRVHAYSSEKRSQRMVHAVLFWEARMTRAGTPAVRVARLLNTLESVAITRRNHVEVVADRVGARSHDNRHDACAADHRSGSRGQRPGNVHDVLRQLPRGCRSRRWSGRRRATAPPADLTQFAKHNGGIFNGARIHSIVDGRAVKAHGTMEMPVWGDAFKWREGLPEDAIKTRIEALVRYLETIQERASH